VLRWCPVSHARPGVPKMIDMLWPIKWAIDQLLEPPDAESDIVTDEVEEEQEDEVLASESGP